MLVRQNEAPRCSIRTRSSSEMRGVSSVFTVGTMFCSGRILLCLRLCWKAAGAVLGSLVMNTAVRLFSPDLGRSPGDNLPRAGLRPCLAGLSAAQDQHDAPTDLHRA